MRVLLRVVDEHGAMMVAARTEAEEREHNRRLREEQDQAYREALQADQVGRGGEEGGREGGSE